MRVREKIDAGKLLFVSACAEDDDDGDEGDDDEEEEENEAFLPILPACVRRSVRVFDNMGTT